MLGSLQRIWIGLATTLVALGLWGCAQGISRAPGQDGGPTDTGQAWDGAPEPVCGNGVPESGEECDDGNTEDGDGCSSICTLEAPCGPESCPNGCCDDQGRCLSGGSDRSCGRGGASCRDCTADGLYCIDGSCQQAGECQPGDTTECDLCGQRVCQPDGTWGPCQNQRECNPGDMRDLGSCQRCGTLRKFCQQDCTWGQVECVDQGDCDPDEVQQGGGCERCGHQERRCRQDCTWGSWQCVGQGECEIGSSRDCGDCGRQDCTGSCTWGACEPYYSCPSGETCSSSGQCVVSCGDGQCGAGEDCSSCPEDCGPDGHMGTGRRNEPCNEPPETWRCVWYPYDWGDAWTSQVCRNGYWLNWNVNPADCAACCWDYSPICDQP